MGFVDIEKYTEEEKARVLTTALIRAATKLGLSRIELIRVIRVDPIVLFRNGVYPDSQAGELAIYLIRCYKLLYSLMGGDPICIQHWMSTPNKGTHGIPLEQIQSTSGLILVTRYLESLRG